MIRFGMAAVNDLGKFEVRVRLATSSQHFDNIVPDLVYD